MKGDQIYEYVRKWDIFGYPINVFYAGQHHFKTALGSVCSFLAFALITTQFFWLTLDFMTGGQDESTSFTHLNRFESATYSLKEESFRFSYFLNQELPERIGRFRIDQYNVNECNDYIVILDQYAEGCTYHLKVVDDSHYMMTKLK